MLSKTIKQYDRLQGYTYGAKVTKSTFQMFKKYADERMMTVNTAINTYITKLISEGLDLTSFTSELQSCEGVVRVRLSKSSYDWVERTRAAILLSSGLFVSDAGVLALIIRVNQINAEKRSNTSQNTNVRGSKQPENVKYNNQEQERPNRPSSTADSGESLTKLSLSSGTHGAQ